jgi:NADPH:quinone reductase-like Zn-dependent oxidoreductase
MNADLAQRTRAAGRRFAGITVEPDYPGLEALAALVEAGKVRVHVSHSLPLEQVGKAHHLLEAGGGLGKIVLTI